MDCGSERTTQGSSGRLWEARGSFSLHGLAGLVLGVLLISAAGAQEESASDETPDREPNFAQRREPGFHRRRPRHWEPREHWPEPEGDITLAPIHSGLLFVEGKFISPPYLIRTDGDALLVNDQPIRSEFFREQRDWRASHDSGFSARSMRLDQLSSALAGGSIVLSFEGEPLAILGRSSAGYQLLGLLIGRDGADQTQAVSELPPQFDTERIDSWIAAFQPTPELRHNAEALITEVQTAEAESRREIAAVRRNDTLLYLVTVFGMVISVAATGHLLSSKPPTAKDADADPEMVKMVSRSLGLVVVLSSLDLFWTIMASQSGKMIELNPIGSHLLHDPMQLIAAKAVIICGSVGLLYFLRHHRQAQTAAWWACLICTLLTFRWLTFNSMFV